MSSVRRARLDGCVKHKTRAQKKAAAFVRLRLNHTRNALHARHLHSLKAALVSSKLLRRKLTILDVSAGVRRSHPIGDRLRIER